MGQARRLAVARPDAGAGDRVDKEALGYPATNQFLDGRALEPDLGLYSTPSYLLNAEVVRAS